MIKPTIHIAVYKWKRFAPIADIEQSISSLTAIKDDVPGLGLITWGRNTSQYGEGYTHTILIIGQSADDIEQYRKHPLHMPVADLLDKWEETGIGIDFQEP